MLHGCINIVLAIIMVGFLLVAGPYVLATGAIGAVVLIISLLLLCVFWAYVTAVIHHAKHGYYYIIMTSGGFYRFAYSEVCLHTILCGHGAGLREGEIQSMTIPALNPKECYDALVRSYGGSLIHEDYYSIKHTDAQFHCTGILRAPPLR